LPRVNKKARGSREATASDVSPAPTADASVASGNTPLAAVATIESVKDVGTQVSMSYATDFGYVLHDMEYEAPNDARIQMFARVMKYSTHGYFGAVASQIGQSRIDDFYTKLYDELLRKAVIRDGYRHLPDTMDSGLSTDAPFGLWVGEVINVRAVRALIDSVSWNDATKWMAGELSRKNRRATEVWNALQTIQVPNLYRMQALLHPPVSDRPGGSVILTLINNKDYFSQVGTVDGSHPCCLDLAPGDISLDSAQIDNILCEAEAAMQIFRNEAFIKSLDGDSGGGLAWDVSSGRGKRLDLKYYFILINELVYPSGLPDPGQIIVDPGEFTQTLYGDAIYGIYAKKTMSVVDNRYPVGYPFVANAPMGMVYRRGFNQLSPIFYAGLKQVWAVDAPYGDDHSPAIFGSFAQYSKVDSGDDLFDCNAYQMWDRVQNGFRTANLDVNFDDATELRTWMEEGSPASDHQWNEMLFSKLDSLPMHGPAGIKAYGFHMPVEIPFDLMRSALCSSWNIPFVR
jgi:hypothetical protein